MSFCMKINCNTNFDDPGVIEVKMPVFFEGEFLHFYLCRPCFLLADNMHAGEFRKWVHSE